MLDLELAELPLTALAADPANERGPVDATAPGTRALAGSVQARGLVEPIRAIRDADGRYLTLFGHRRLAAARLAGLTTVPVLVETTARAPHERAIDRLISNTQREELTGPQVAGALYTLLSANAGLTQRELGALVGMTQGQVANLLRLLKLPDDVQDLLRTGALSTQIGICLLRIYEDEYGSDGKPTGRTAADVQRVFAQQALADDLGRRKLDRLLDEYLRLQVRNRAIRRPRLPAPTNGHSAPPPPPRLGRPPAYRQAETPPAVPVAVPAPPPPVPSPPPPPRIVTVTREMEDAERRAREAEILAARRDVAAAVLTSALIAAEDPVSPDLRLGCVLALQASPCATERERGQLLQEIEQAGTLPELLMILGALGRAALTLGPEAHSLAPTAINAWADRRYGLNRALAEALYSDDLLPARTYRALTGIAP